MRHHSSLIIGIFNRDPVAAAPVGAPPPVTGAAPDTARGPVPTRGTPRLRVFADCQAYGCDFDYFRTEIPFVDYVRNRQDASIHILVTADGTGGGGLPTL